jgi:hypothetical protein
LAAILPGLVFADPDLMKRLLTILACMSLLMAPALAEAASVTCRVAAAHPSKHKKAQKARPAKANKEAKSRVTGSEGITEEDLLMPAKHSSRG